MLRDHVSEAKVTAADLEGFAFGRAGGSPFNHSTPTSRADRAWKAAGLERITFHEARHTFASLLIDAGVDPKAIQTYLGHASIATTFDLYGHLMPSAERETTRRMDDYLALADTRSRLDQLAPAQS